MANAHRDSERRVAIQGSFLLRLDTDRHSGLHSTESMCHNPTFRDRIHACPAVAASLSAIKRSRDFVRIPAGYEVGQAFALNQDVLPKVLLRFRRVPVQDRLDNALVFIKRVGDAMPRA